MDTWNELQVNCSWLSETHQRDHEEPCALVAEGLETLRSLEQYWAFPGREQMEDITRLFERRDYDALARTVRDTVRLLIGDAYRSHEARKRDRSSETRPGQRADSRERRASEQSRVQRPYFEVLVVDSIGPDEEAELRESLQDARREEDEFTYDIVTAPSFEDAIIAVLFNRTIQTCVLRYQYAFRTKNPHPIFRRYLDMIDAEQPEQCYGLRRSLTLGRIIKKLRPEVDLFLVTDTPLDEVAGSLGRCFRRAFYRLEQYLELHLSILKGIQTRWDAPFFDALRRYSAKPTGVFHALPIARGKSMTNSHWARDLLDFYGPNIFLAETSSTGGGLDSLLQPRGPIKRAQQAAARAFGARHTFFVTNGTSTANKVVVQALVQPGDIVLVDRDCHKSHHYALMLAGAFPVYLDSYPLTEYSMYGAVPLEEILTRLRELKAAGKLDRVRMLLLTNCTFDGVTYDPERVMREVLAIKPDMIFLWDEAWFAFASFSPTLRRRTAMAAAAELRTKLRSDEYRTRYADRGEQSMPDPDLTRIRVYATHSTHKTLTALRQGSMIHVYDEDFEQKAAEAFHEAYMTHTSTSPNYQIIASLDVGRRQVELEGYELVHRSIGLAMILRERINEHPLIRKYFSVLRPADMIPPNFRPSGLEAYYDPDRGWERMEDGWRTDEFTLDPTRVTIQVGATGMDGDTFRNLLINEYDIQINKTSRNTALFMTNIGTARGDIAYLVEVLAKVAQELDDRLSMESTVGIAHHEARVASLTENQPPLPNFSAFHPAFRPDDGTPEGDLRKAFFLAYDDSRCEFLPLDGSVSAALDAGREVVSAAFVTPYPPGFPVLVPGQVMSRAILDYLHAVDVKEIHGYDPQYGLRIFTEAALAETLAAPSLALSYAHEEKTP
ncbi:MAG: ornithine decarboxylase [Phycisphaerales bacterium]|nr:ornithine decarboxylase [Phycisphaerae bacterium]NNF42619.1 ornithine decarboxylase [Phycisphaerales bacterium]NNM24647.1 ornithine decarboxylase [Phycisphaerales bacterium]